MAQSGRRARPGSFYSTTQAPLRRSRAGVLGQFQLQSRPQSADPGRPTTPDRQSLGFSTNFSPTAFWSLSWSSQYNITDGKFESQVVRLERDLHEWRASFNFIRNPNGNFAFYFSIYLTDLPELKFDYDQTTFESKCHRVGTPASTPVLLISMSFRANYLRLAKRWHDLCTSPSHPLRRNRMRGWWIPAVLVAAACSDNNSSGPGTTPESPTTLSSVSLDGAIALSWSDNAVCIRSQQFPELPRVQHHLQHRHQSDRRAGPPSLSRARPLRRSSLSAP